MNTQASRKTVLFHVPEDLACYGDWDFKVFPGVFALFVDVPCADLDRLISEDRRDFIRLLFGLFCPKLNRFPKSHLRLPKYRRDEQTGTDSDFDFSDCQIAIRCIACNCWIAAPQKLGDIA